MVVRAEIARLISIPSNIRVNPNHGGIFVDVEPMWLCRQLRQSEQTTCPEIENALATLGARRLAMEHTPNQRLYCKPMRG
jgi:hypothetical protein